MAYPLVRTKLSLRYIGGKFEVCNAEENEIEGHVLLEMKGKTTEYTFVRRRDYTKVRGASMRDVLQQAFGRNITYTIEAVL
jgi:hypothetical protein